MLLTQILLQMSKLNGAGIMFIVVGHFAVCVDYYVDSVV